MRSYADYRKGKLKEMVYRVNVREGVDRLFEVLQLELSGSIKLPEVVFEGNDVCSVAYKLKRNEDYQQNKDLVRNVISHYKNNFYNALLEEAAAIASDPYADLKRELIAKIKEVFQQIRADVTAALNVSRSQTPEDAETAAAARDIHGGDGASATDGTPFGGRPGATDGTPFGGRPGATSGGPTGGHGSTPGGSGYGGGAPGSPTVGHGGSGYGGHGYAPHGGSTSGGNWGRPDDRRHKYDPLNGIVRPATSTGFQPATYGSMRPSDGYLSGLGRLIRYPLRRLTRGIRRVWHGDDTREHSEYIGGLFTENLDALMQKITDIENDLITFINYRIDAIQKAAGASPTATPGAVNPVTGKPESGATATPGSPATPGSSSPSGIPGRLPVTPRGVAGEEEEGEDEGDHQRMASTNAATLSPAQSNTIEKAAAGDPIASLEVQQQLGYIKSACDALGMSFNYEGKSVNHGFKLDNMVIDGKPVLVRTIDPVTKKSIAKESTHTWSELRSQVLRRIYANFIHQGNKPVPTRKSPQSVNKKGRTPRAGDKLTADVLNYLGIPSFKGTHEGPDLTREILLLLGYKLAHGEIGPGYGSSPEQSGAEGQGIKSEPGAAPTMIAPTTAGSKPTAVPSASNPTTAPTAQAPGDESGDDDPFDQAVGLINHIKTKDPETFARMLNNFRKPEQTDQDAEAEALQAAYDAMKHEKLTSDAVHARMKGLVGPNPATPTEKPQTPAAPTAKAPEAHVTTPPTSATPESPTAPATAPEPTPTTEPESGVTNDDFPHVLSAFADQFPDDETKKILSANYPPEYLHKFLGDRNIGHMDDKQMEDLVKQFTDYARTNPSGQTETQPETPEAVPSPAEEKPSAAEPESAPQSMVDKLKSLGWNVNKLEGIDNIVKTLRSKNIPDEQILKVINQSRSIKGEPLLDKLPDTENGKRIVPATAPTTGMPTKGGKGKKAAKSAVPTAPLSPEQPTIPSSPRRVEKSPAVAPEAPKDDWKTVDIEGKSPQDFGINVNRLNKLVASPLGARLGEKGVTDLAMRAVGGDEGARGQLPGWVDLTKPESGDTGTVQTHKPLNVPPSPVQRLKRDINMDVAGTPEWQNLEKEYSRLADIMHARGESGYDPKTVAKTVDEFLGASDPVKMMRIAVSHIKKELRDQGVTEPTSSPGEPEPEIAPKTPAPAAMSPAQKRRAAQANASLNKPTAAPTQSGNTSQRMAELGKNAEFKKIIDDMYFMDPDISDEIERQAMDMIKNGESVDDVVATMKNYVANFQRPEPETPPTPKAPESKPEPTPKATNKPEPSPTPAENLTPKQKKARDREAAKKAKELAAMTAAGNEDEDEDSKKQREFERGMRSLHNPDDTYDYGSDEDDYEDRFDGNKGKGKKKDRKNKQKRGKDQFETFADRLEAFKKLFKESELPTPPSKLSPSQRLLFS